MTAAHDCREQALAAQVPWWRRLLHAHRTYFCNAQHPHATAEARDACPPATDRSGGAA